MQHSTFVIPSEVEQAAVVIHGLWQLLHVPGFITQHGLSPWRTK